MMSERMREESSENGGVLTGQRLSRLGLEVKLDKGFADGTYCVYVEFDHRAERAGFAASRRTAREYCALLKGNLLRFPGHRLGEIQDGSRSDDPRRKRDLESTFLWFEIQSDDGRFHDDAIREHFGKASLRAGQVWDQVQAKAEAQRRDSRQEKFRRLFANLLESPAYAHIDAITKEALLKEVPALAFPPRGMER
jgi:hypothetical protein